MWLISGILREALGTFLCCRRY